MALLTALALAACVADGPPNYSKTGYEPPRRPDAAYADAVMAALSQAEQTAWAEAARRGAVDDQLREELSALMRDGQVDALAHRMEARVQALRPQPEGRLYQARDVIDYRDDCLAAEGMIDLSSIASDDLGPEPAHFLLTRDDARRGANPTPWRLEAVLHVGSVRALGLSCEADNEGFILPLPS